MTREVIISGKTGADKKEKLSILGAVILIILVVVGVVSAIANQVSERLDAETPTADLDANAPSFDEMLAKAGENYDEDMYSGDGPQVFASYVYDEAYNGDITFSRAYKYYDEMASRIEDPQSKLSYCYEYAKDYYKLNRSIDNAVETFGKCQPESELGADLLSQYYTFMSSLYQTGGNTEKADYFSNLAVGATPEATVTENAYDVQE